MNRFERLANLARAGYELHLINAHDKNTDDRAIMRNLETVVREGRLKP